MITSLTAWLAAFLFTEAVETPIYYLALRRRRWAVRLILALGANVLTHPLAWIFVVNAGADLGYWPAVWLAEACAILIETTYLTLLAVPVALRWSIAANAGSLGLGLLPGAHWSAMNSDLRSMLLVGLALLTALVAATPRTLADMPRFVRKSRDG